MQRSVQRTPVQKSSEPKTMMNTHSHAFAVVAAIDRTSWACVGSSHVVETLQNLVSLGPEEHAVTTVLWPILPVVMGKCEWSY